MLARVKLKGIDGGPHKRWSMWFNSMQREEPYQGLTCRLLPWERDLPYTSLMCKRRTQVVHGCRQLVPWGVGLSPITSATLVFSYVALFYIAATRETAGDKPEEGEDDVKSACPLCPGLHTCYNGRDKGLQLCEEKPTSKTRSQFGLEAATRLHEVGIASNRRSAIRRWIRSRALYTPPVTLLELARPEAVALTLGRGTPKAGLVTGVKS